MLGLLLAIAAQASISALGEKATYEELGQVDLSPRAEHCWKPVKDGRVGVAFGLADAFVAETKWADFEKAGMRPSIGMHLFARHNGSDAYPALVVGINGEVVTVATDISLVGSMFVEPIEPLALYLTDTRMPALTPHVWSNELSRKDWLAVMDCYDKTKDLSRD